MWAGEKPFTAEAQRTQRAAEKKEEIFFLYSYESTFLRSLRLCGEGVFVEGNKTAAYITAPICHGTNSFCP